MPQVDRPRKKTNLPSAAQQAFWDRMLSEAIQPNADEIVRIFAAGGVACLAWELLPENHEAARCLGWDERSTVFPMPDQVRRRLAKSLGAMGDTAAERWLTESREHPRLYVMVHSGTFLLNFSTEKGGWLHEPGSLDHEWMS